MGDPYALIDPQATYPGSSGTALAWDGFRWFYGRVINQAWFDLQAAQQIGGILV